MDAETEKAYWHIRKGGSGFFEQLNGLIAVWGKEAVQFLDGLITNDMKTLADGEQMLAAFPNAQGRLLAVVRVLRQGKRFLIETEAATREKVYQNLFRFTFAGEFFVEDMSEAFRFLDLFGLVTAPPRAQGYSVQEHSSIDEGGFRFFGFAKSETFAHRPDGPPIRKDCVEISSDLYETLRIEHGIPRYGIDMDETTVVPELGLDGLISYNKGCYIGQEIIARIHFRGHVAKQLTGLLLSQPVAAGSELITAEGKSAGRITSLTFSPALEKNIALGFVRYDNLARDTKLFAGETEATVVGLPFEV